MEPHLLQIYIPLNGLIHKAIVKSIFVIVFQFLMTQEEYMALCFLRILQYKGEDQIDDFYESEYLCETRCLEILKSKHELMIFGYMNQFTFCN